ncbi:MAG: PH domain-containing protein [Gammaproteobacteria bacterium]|nr:PH domain-containing protein [Gammaproteobacteria bacterium]
MNARRVYRSKTTPWLVGVMVLAMVVLVGALWTAWRDGSPAEFAIAAPLHLLGLVLVLSGFHVRYWIADSVLHVRASLFRWRIPVDSIISVTPSRSWMSAPALSLDRLAILHKKGTVMISPRDEAAFLRELEQARGRAKS